MEEGKSGMPGWFERYAESVAEGAIGAIPVGVARNYIRRQINPGAISLPVDRRAWYLNVGAGALGLVLKGMAYAGRYGKDETLDDIGEGLLYPAIAYTAEDVAHELMRRSAPTAPQGGFPTPSTVARINVSSLPARAAAPAGRVTLSEDF
jgi:hypothetical protein